MSTQNLITRLAQISNPLTTFSNRSSPDTVNTLITNAINAAFVIGIIIFLVILLAGGIEWITSGGERSKLESAKSRLTNGLVGIVILLSIYALAGAVGRFFGVGILTFEGNYTPGGPGGPGSTTPSAGACARRLENCASIPCCSGFGLTCTGNFCLGPNDTPVPSPTRDPSNCGPNATYNGTVCICNTGFGNCDNSWDTGCEVNLRSDFNNCGVCGNVCTSGSCVNGSCQCVPNGGSCGSNLDCCSTYCGTTGFCQPGP